MSPALEAVRTLTRRYRGAQVRGEQRRDELVAAIVVALAAGERPGDVADTCPFSPAYVRRLARAAGIPPARPHTRKGKLVDDYRP
jgi:hypothetical protein